MYGLFQFLPVAGAITTQFLPLLGVSSINLEKISRIHHIFKIFLLFFSTFGRKRFYVIPLCGVISVPGRRKYGQRLKNRYGLAPLELLQQAEVDYAVWRRNSADKTKKAKQMLF
uniref:(northern house mosquito) hypothetical protein n=1 Tax=Culex pipiens TaxID=7175 RepID=A0A8D8G307_CULPI